MDHIEGGRVAFGEMTKHCQYFSQVVKVQHWGKDQVTNVSSLPVQVDLSPVMVQSVLPSKVIVESVDGNKKESGRIK